MNTADAPIGAQGVGTVDYAPRRPAAGALPEVPGLSSRARLAAALLGIAIGLLAVAACAALGILLAQAIFGTTGGIL